MAKEIKFLQWRIKCLGGEKMDWKVDETKPMANQLRIVVSLPVEKVITIDTTGMSNEEIAKTRAQEVAKTAAELRGQMMQFFRVTAASLKIPEKKITEAVEEEEHVEEPEKETTVPVEVHEEE